MRFRSVPSLLTCAVVMTVGPAAVPRLSAQPASKQMLASSVMVYGVLQENGKTVPVSRGGGFVIDARHVVSYFQACCDKDEKGQQTTPVVSFGDVAFPAKVVWTSQETHATVLEMDRATDHPGVTLAPSKLTAKGQAVYSAQFPNPGDKGDAAIAQGTLQDVLTSDKTTEQIFKTSVTLNKANSGGALFDACANVIAVNAGMKDGDEYAFAIDTLLGGLKSAGVSATVASSACNGTTSSAEKKQPTAPKRRVEWRLPEGNEWIPVGILVGLIGLAFRKGTRQQVSRVLTTRSVTLPEPAPYPYPAAPVAAAPPARVVVMPQPSGPPALRGIAGQYAGTSILLDAGSSTLGRDPRAANLVFPMESDSVSKRHCTVRWDAPRQVFVLEDHGSTNGTFLVSGERLAPNRPYDLRPGDRFYIGDLRNQFEVGMEGRP